MESPDKDKNPPPEKNGDKSNWSHDIEERDYYYDDSTGYEVYDPDENENEDSDPTPEEKSAAS